MQTIENIAKACLFGQSNTIQQLLGTEFELRKNKTTADFKAAVLRGVKQGRGKTEFELSMEVQLQSIIKRKKTATKLKPEV